MNKLIEKYRDLIPYAVFGVLTTFVNIVSYWILSHGLAAGVMPSTVIAWILSVLFAYATNRKWVFHSEAAGLRALMKECLSFFAARLLTGLLDWLIMYVFVERMEWNDLAMKILSNLIVIVLNYAASKFVIFRHKS